MSITLKLNPQVPAGEVRALTIECRDKTLVLNSKEYLDLSFMSPGDHLLAGAISHPLLAGAEIRCTVEGLEIDGLLFHIDAMQTDPAACFPEPVIITHDGVVPLPAQTLSFPEPTPEPGLVSVETSDIEQDHEHQD